MHQEAAGFRRFETRVHISKVLFDTVVTDAPARSQALSFKFIIDCTDIYDTLE